MPLTEQEVRSIASDARIALSDQKIQAMTGDLNQIMDHILQIGEYDLTGVEPTYHPIAGLRNVMRDDQVLASLPREVALANASATEDGQFKVPPILSGQELS